LVQNSLKLFGSELGYAVLWLIKCCI